MALEVAAKNGAIVAARGQATTTLPLRPPSTPRIRSRPEAAAQRFGGALAGSSTLELGNAPPSQGGVESSKKGVRLRERSQAS